MSRFVSKYATILAIVFASITACSSGKPGIASLQVSRDVDGKVEAAIFKGGESLFASAVLTNAPGKGKIVFSIKNDKGAILPGTEFKADLAGNSTAAYKAQVAEKAPGGNYILTADLHDGNGEKKDTKSVNITIESNGLKQ